MREERNQEGWFEHMCMECLLWQICLLLFIIDLCRKGFVDTHLSFYNLFYLTYLLSLPTVSVLGAENTDCILFKKHIVFFKFHGFENHLGILLKLG